MISNYLYSVSENYEPDSLKLRIPLKKVKTINDEIRNNVVLFDMDTSEILKEFKKNAYYINDEGIKSYFVIAKSIVGTEKGSIKTAKRDEFLICLISSKLLKDRYFQRITLENIKIIYDYLMSYNVVYFTFEDFLNADCTDVDFAKDTEMNKDLFVHGIKTLNQYVRPESKGITHLFNEKYNKGIQFSQRETTRFRDVPFGKIYNKTLELKGRGNKEEDPNKPRIKNTKDFNEHYLRYYPTDENIHISRCEYTIKNKLHFASFGIKSTKLKDILSLDPEIKKTMALNFIYKHLSEDIRPLLKDYKGGKKLQPNDIAILKLLEIGIKNTNYDINTFIEIMTEDIIIPSQRSRKQKEYRLLYNEHLKLEYHKKMELNKEKTRDLKEILEMFV